MIKRLTPVRSAVAVAAAALCVAGLVACSSGTSDSAASNSANSDSAASSASATGGDASGTSAAGGGSAAGGEFTWWDPYPQHDASSDWEKRVDACGTEAGVTIKRTAYDTTALTNQALLAGQEGSSPDVILFDNPAVSTLADAGILTSMKDINFDTSAFDKNLIAAGELGGDTFGVPIGANTLALYYNKTVLDAAGVDPATITDWASLNAALAKVTATGKGGITFAGIGTEEGSFQFLPWFWGAGADLKQLDSPQAVAALDLWTELGAGRDCAELGDQQLPEHHLGGIPGRELRLRRKRHLAGRQRDEGPLPHRGHPDPRHRTVESHRHRPAVNSSPFPCRTTPPGTT